MVVVLLTRPIKASEAFEKSLRAVLTDGAATRIVTSPLLEIVPTGTQPRLSGAHGVIFTSKNGVAFAGQAAAVPAFCVGDQTADAAQAKGWSVAQVYITSEDLIAGLIETRPAAPLVHLAGLHRRGDIAARLSRAGLPTSVEEIYDQVHRDLTPEALSLLQTTSDVIVPLFSPRTAAQFAKCVPGAARPHIVSMSAAVATELVPDNSASHSVAVTPDRKGMIAAILKVLRRVEAADAPQ